MIAGITDWILSLHGAMALLIVFLIPALEASAFLGFLFPGEIAIVLGGVLASQGQISLPAAIAAAVLGAFIGDSAGYFVGRRWGRAMLRWMLGHLPLLRHRVEDHLDRAESFLQRRGPHAVLVGRFTAALRVMVPGLAGMSGMAYGSFALYNAIGAVLWGTSFVLLGFFAGAAWPHVAGIASRAGLVLLVAILVGMVAAALIRKHREAGIGLGDRLTASRPVAMVRRTFPRQASWLAARLDTASPQGFLLTFAMLLGTTCAWVFFGLLQDVVGHEEAVTLDPGIESYAVAHRDSLLNAGMRIVTWLGSNAVLIPLCLGVGGILIVRRRAIAPALAPVMSLGVAIVMYNVAKVSVGRARPPVSIHLLNVSGFAFPSGHATAATAVWGAIALVVTTGRSTPVKIATWSAAGLIVILVGVSRVYLGVHWFTDVVAGWALGGVSLSAVVALSLAIPTWRRVSSEPPPKAIPEVQIAP